MKAIKYNKRKFLMVLLPALVVALALLVSRSSVAQSGDEQWNKTFGGSGYDVGYCVTQTSDGGYIIAGEARSYADSRGDAWLIKTDSEGDEQWNKTFGGLGYYDVSYSVDQTSDGGYIVTGWTRSYGAGRDSVWLIKVGVNPADSTTGDKWYKTFNGFD